VRAPSEVPPDVRAVTASEPAPEPAQAPNAAPAVLPLTGAAASREATAGGGLALSLGGLAVLGGAGRRKRRRTGA
jgi:hypothetical protein